VEAGVGQNLKNQPSTDLRIAIFSPRIFPVFYPEIGKRTAGGAETQQRMLAEYLAQQGCRVSIICYGPKPDEQIQFSPRISLRTLPAPGRRGVPGMRFLYPNMSDAITALIDCQPHLIYQRAAGFATAAAAVASHRLEVPFVFACASDNEATSHSKNLAGGIRVRSSFQVGLALATHILVQNQLQLDAMMERYPNKSSLIPNMIPIDESLAHSNVHSEKKEILWIGSLQTIKRPDRFLAMVQRCPNLQFHMICSSTGDASRERPYLQAMEQAKSLPNLRVTSFVEPHLIYQSYLQAALLVNTSDSEGFPNTFLEAWRLGVPVVSFVDPKIGNAAMPQWVVTDEDSMIAAIHRLMSNAQLHEDFSRRSIAYVQAIHDSRVVIPQYMELFMRLLHVAEPRVA
jgi:glycosyltransferase involved in cell wall biosynthesis